MAEATKKQESLSPTTGNGNIPSHPVQVKNGPHLEETINVAGSQSSETICFLTKQHR